MAKFTIVVGHPDPALGHLNGALADSYAKGARVAGHEVRRIDVAALDFPILRTTEAFLSADVPEPIRQAQRDIAWADHLAFFYPLWMGDVPALFKAFIEQTFRPGFAMTQAARGLPKPLLGGKSARLIVTMGMPAIAYRTQFPAHALKSLVHNLQMCGVSPVESTIVGGVGALKAKRVRRLQRKMECLALGDARKPRSRTNAAGVVLAAGILTAGAYLAYAGYTFARFGSSGRKKTLVDTVMPEYDVRLHHATRVRATASQAFGAMKRTDVDRSPVVQGLFKARELIMRARHDDRRLPHGLPAQLESFGWTVVAEEPGRELVFGAVTQPWRANPVFKGLSAEEFDRFDEPGYAKIALTLRVEPIAHDRCVVETETRVMTTDPASRERFRRYWAFLSPGMEIIRLVLLARVKAAAESTWRVA